MKMLLIGYSPQHLLCIFLSVFLHNVVLCASMPCPLGEIFTFRRCIPCPPGTYRPFRFGGPLGPNVCRPCPKGTFNPHSGAVSIALCRPCYPGTFANTTGSTECTPCSPGTIAKRGARRCLACGPGTFYSDFEHFNTNNPSFCKPCPRAFYSNGSANFQCEQCPIGFTTREKRSTSSSECVLCPAGTDTRVGREGCQDCDYGLFKPTAAPGSCLRCPPNMTAGGGRNTKCELCPIGFRRGGNLGCYRCPDGQTTAKGGARFCRRLDYPCPPDMFENKNGDCENCLKGYKVNRMTLECEKCPPGTVSMGGLQEKCKRCPAGQFPDRRRPEMCRCHEGYIRNVKGVCEKCAPGTFRDLDFFSDITRCDKCARGTFSDSAGAAFCKPCPAGTVADVEGSKSCKRCANGTMPNIAEQPEEEAIGCVNVRTRCPLGWVLNKYETCKRIACRVGTKKEDIGRTCAPCEAGERLDNSGERCKRCGSRTYSLGGVITNCTVCPNGRYRLYNDATKCHCGIAGFGIQDGKCKVCKEGTYADPYVERCIPCPPGYFSNRVGVSSECTECPFGKVAPRKGSTKCVRCRPGTRPNTFQRATFCVAETS